MFLSATQGLCFFFSSRRRHTRLQGDWSSDVCSSDLAEPSPHVTCRCHGLSFAPGSLNEPRPNVFDSPSFAVSSVGGERLGGTFFTVTTVVYSLEPSSLSKIRARTV